MNSNDLVIWESVDSHSITTRIALAGDFLPAGKLAFPMGASWREMAGNLSGYFQDIAATFVNLECPVGVEGLAPRLPLGLGQAVSASSGSLEYLGAIRTQSVGIANNHSCDFGLDGIALTRQAISRHGMVPLGAGCNLKDPAEVFIWQASPALRIGFWAAAKASSDLATRNVAGVEPATLERGSSALEEMNNRGANFHVALLHAGCLRTNRPDPEDVSLMDSLAKIGFDIVAASHSHRISGYKRIDNPRSQSFCFYGLGSLVSGYAATPLEREGLVVVAGFDQPGEFARLEVRPVLLDENGFGTVPDVPVADTILARFRQLSGELADGSYEKYFYQDMSRGLVHLYLRDARATFHNGGVRGLAKKVRRIRLRHVKRLVHKMTG